MTRTTYQQLQITGVGVHESELQITQKAAAGLEFIRHTC